MQKKNIQNINTYNRLIVNKTETRFGRRIDNVMTLVSMPERSIFWLCKNDVVLFSIKNNLQSPQSQDHFKRVLSPLFLSCLLIGTVDVLNHRALLSAQS